MTALAGATDLYDLFMGSPLVRIAHGLSKVASSHGLRESINAARPARSESAASHENGERKNVAVKEIGHDD